MRASGAENVCRVILRIGGDATRGFRSGRIMAFGALKSKAMDERRRDGRCRARPFPADHYPDNINRGQHTPALSKAQKRIADG